MVISWAGTTIVFCAPWIVMLLMYLSIVATSGPYLSCVGIVSVSCVFMIVDEDCIPVHGPIMFLMLSWACGYFYPAVFDPHCIPFWLLAIERFRKLLMAHSV